MHRLYTFHHIFHKNSRECPINLFMGFMFIYGQLFTNIFILAVFINLSGVMAIRVQINVFGRTQCVLTKRVEKFFAPTKSVFIRIIFGRFFTKIPVNFPLIYL